MLLVRHNVVWYDVIRRDIIKTIWLESCKVGEQQRQFLFFLCTNEAQEQNPFREFAQKALRNLLKEL